MPAQMMYAMATGKIFKIPIIVRHFPLTSSTHSTKLTTTTAIEQNPIITRSIIKSSSESQNPSRKPEEEKRINDC